MNESLRDALENKHNVYIDSITDQFNLNSYDDQYGWNPIPDEWLLCAHCKSHYISDDQDIAEQMLCDSCASDSCAREINDNEIIGWKEVE